MIKKFNMLFIPYPLPQSRHRNKTTQPQRQPVQPVPALTSTQDQRQNACHCWNIANRNPKQKHTYPVQENQSPNGGATDFQRGVPQMSIDVVEIF
jgi:hypothetical protein